MGDTETTGGRGPRGHGQARNPDEDQDSRCRSRQEIRDQRSVISDHRHQISISRYLSQAPRGESSAVKGDQCISHIHGGGHERIA